MFILPQAGRSSKRQLFLFPGGIERHAKIKTCSVSVQPALLAIPDPWCLWGNCCNNSVCLCVLSFFQIALEVIEELCYEMGLHRLEAMEEYAIFLVTNRGVLADVCFSVSHTLTHIKGRIRAQRSILLLLSVRQIHSQITCQTDLWFLDVGESPSWVRLVLTWLNHERVPGITIIIFISYTDITTLSTLSHFYIP